MDKGTLFPIDHHSMQGNVDSLTLFCPVSMWIIYIVARLQRSIDVLFFLFLSHSHCCHFVSIEMIEQTV